MLTSIASLYPISQVDRNLNLKVIDFGLCRGDMTDQEMKYLTKAGTGTLALETIPCVPISPIFTVNIDPYLLSVV